MKLRFIACTLPIVLAGCKDTPKQIEYSHNIDTHIDKIENLVKNNNNTIDQTNIPAIKTEWGLIIDNIQAYELTEKSKPCTEPECQTAFREGKEHLASMKQYIKAAHRDTALDLNSIFTMPNSDR